jgi:hypothetical protein
VETDELARHMRRVMWCGSNLQQEPVVYVTTTVNFGDMLEECIAIAATRETGRLFGGDIDEAA